MNCESASRQQPRVWCSLITFVYAYLNTISIHTSSSVLVSKSICEFVWLKCECKYILSRDEIYMEISLKHKNNESTRYDARLSLIHSCPMLLGYIIFALYSLFVVVFVIVAVDADVVIGYGVCAFIELILFTLIQWFLVRTLNLPFGIVFGYFYRVYCTFQIFYLFTYLSRLQPFAWNTRKQHTKHNGK